MDINGNVKYPIGHGIDDVNTKSLYQKDRKHDDKLRKLSAIRRKSQQLYTKSPTNKRSKDQLVLPYITTPIIPSEYEKELEE